MKPKEIRKWFVLLTIAFSLVSSEYCTRDKRDVLKFERRAVCQTTENRFREDDTNAMVSKPLNHRFQVKSSREFDFSRERLSHRSNYPNVEKQVQNGRRKTVEVIRHRETRNKLNTIPFSRSTERRKYTDNTQRSFRKPDSVFEVSLVQNARRNQISSKVITFPLQNQAIRREKIQTKRSEKINLKENNIEQRKNGRYNVQNRRDSFNKQGERTTLFKMNRIRINNENRQERNNFRQESIGSVSRERLAVKDRLNNKNRKISENFQKGLFYSPIIEISHKLRIRPRVHEGNFNRLKNRRYVRTEILNSVHGENIIRTEIRSTDERRQDITLQRETSMNLRRNIINGIPVKNNNILRRSVRHTDTLESKSRRNEARTIREEIMNRRHTNRDDGILRENLRRNASKVTRFQTTTERDRTIEQNARGISIRLSPEKIEGRNLRYASYSRLNYINVISTGNKNSKRSIVDKKENHSLSRETNGRMYYSKIKKIRNISEKEATVQVTTINDNINNDRFGIREAELKNIDCGKITTFNSRVLGQINVRTNRREISRTLDRKIAVTRQGIEGNIVESVKRMTTKKNDLTRRQLNGRILITYRSKYPEQSRQLKDVSNTDQRSFLLSNRRILMYSERGQRRQSQATKAMKNWEVKNFDENTNLRINTKNTERWSIQYNDGGKLIARKMEVYQKLGRDLRRYSLTDAMLTRRNVKSLTLMEDYSRSTRYNQRSRMDNMHERRKFAVKSRILPMQNNGRLSTDHITLRNTGLINPGEITRNIPPFIRTIKHTLSNLNMQERIRTTQRNGRGFRSKLDLLRRFAGNRRTKRSKVNESFPHVMQNFENKLPEGTIKNRSLIPERNNGDYSTGNYKLENLYSRSKELHGLSARASHNIRIKVSSSVRNFEKRISANGVVEKMALRERSRRVVEDKSGSIERHNECKKENIKVQDRLITTERSGDIRNLNKQNGSPLTPRNGRGFRGKHTNSVRIERILKYSYNSNKLLLTLFYRKQDISSQAEVQKHVENHARFIVFRGNTQKILFNRNIGKIKNYERALFENERRARNNQRGLREINSNVNTFAVQQKRNRNIRSPQRNFKERATSFKPYFSSTRRSNDRILSLNRSASRRYDMRLEQYMEKVRTGSRKTRDSRILEENKLDNTRQRMSNYRLEDHTVLSIHDALGFPYNSRDTIFENRLIRSTEIHFPNKDHLNANQNWNIRSVFSLIAHIILGLSIIMTASESDPFKCRSFKERLFDALSLRTDVF